MKHSVTCVVAALTLSACVTVPKEQKPNNVSKYEQQCQDRSLVAKVISEKLDAGMSQAAVTRVVNKQYSQWIQASEAQTLVYYIAQSEQLSAEQHQAAYFDWCSEVLMKQNAAAWLPDYFNAVKN